jgi:transposase InsO family protein
MHYRCVDAQRAAGFPVAAACQAAGVTRSAYYAWTARHPSQRQQDDASLVGEVCRIHARSHGAYGSPRITAELRRRGWRVNHKRVERLMPTHGIFGYRSRRRRSLTKPDQAGAPALDLLGRLFDPDQLGSPSHPLVDRPCTNPAITSASNALVRVTWAPSNLGAKRWSVPCSLGRSRVSGPLVVLIVIG